MLGLILIRNHNSTVNVNIISQTTMALNWKILGEQPMGISFLWPNTLSWNLPTWEARRTASLWRYRVKWLVRLKLPVNHFPGGIKSCDPPSDANWLRWSIAALKAFVFDVVPSPTPPKSSNEALWALQLIAGYSKNSKFWALFLLSTPFVFKKTSTPSNPIILSTYNRNQPAKEMQRTNQTELLWTKGILAARDKTKTKTEEYSPGFFWDFSISHPFSNKWRGFRL